MARTTLRLDTNIPVDATLRYADVAWSKQYSREELRLIVQTEAGEQAIYTSLAVASQMIADGLIVGGPEQKADYPRAYRLAGKDLPVRILKAERQENGRRVRETTVVRASGDVTAAAAPSAAPVAGTNPPPASAVPVASAPVPSPQAQEAADRTIRHAWAQLDAAYGAALAIAAFRQIENAQALGLVQFVSLRTIQAGAASLMIAAEKQGIYEASDGLRKQLLERLGGLVNAVGPLLRTEDESNADPDEMPEDEEGDGLPF